MVCPVPLLTASAIHESQTILVVRGGALGDFILTLPIVDALRTRFQRVELLANRLVAELDSTAAEYRLDDPELAALFSFNPSLDPALRDCFNRYSTVISYLHDPDGVFERNVRACGVRNFIAGACKIRSGAHATDQLAALLRHFGIALIDSEPRLVISEAEKAAARGTQTRDYSVAVHPGSGSPQKNWPIGKWIELIDHFRERGKHVLVVVGEADAEQISELRGRFGARIDYAVNWPLRQVAALLSGTTYIGHDSGVSHLAAAAGARCVILFGPSDPLVWAPRNRKVQIIVAPDGELAQLKAEDVRRAVEGTLASPELTS